MKYFLTSLIMTSALAQGALAGHPNGDIKLYDARLVPGIFSMKKKGKLSMVNGSRKWFGFRSAKINSLNENLTFIRDTYAEKYNHISWDNKGSDIEASVNVAKHAYIDFFGMEENAAWIGDVTDKDGNGNPIVTGKRFIFGVGTNEGLKDFEFAMDVVAHEFTHAVIESTSSLEYKGQSGALNEHFADVFGSIFNQFKTPNLANPYLIGSTVLGSKYKDTHHALRDMMDPSKGLSAQPSHMDQVTNPESKFSQFSDSCIPSKSNDNCGVHILSGIPNKVAALIMSVIGPVKTGQMYFHIMTKDMKENSNFADYANALRLECKNHGDRTCEIVNDALLSVGL